ncbi:RHS domain-containing protein, partial [Yokenella regensburgei]|uniref:RHS repeat-associated core domain-containing protein n=1 Tax=Yokenella regensburgei TaxID=158877 RepID=UPI003F15ACA0
PLGNIRTTEWLVQRALPTVITEANGAATRFYYDEHFGLGRVVDAMGQTTFVRRDECGQVTEEVDARGNTYRTEYEDSGLVRSRTDCSGYTTHYRYHPLGWLRSVRTASGEQTSFSYDPAGRTVRVERAEGWLQTLEWNAAGQMVRQIAADGSQSEFEYDATGRLVTTRDPLGQEHHRRWDNRNRLTELKNPNGESYRFEWGAGSLLLAEVGLDGVATRYSYDACGRMVSREFASGHQEAITHLFNWNAAGQLQSRATPEALTRYTYSPLGQITRIAVYPPLGDNIWSQCAEQELTFTFDVLGRLTQEQGENGALSWRYDELGNCTTVELPQGQSLNYLHYGSGHLLSVAYEGIGISDFTRDDMHRETSRTLGGLTCNSEYDRLGRLQRRDVFTGHSQRPAPRRWARRWDYDYQSQLVREERDDNPFNWSNWQYDDIGRLLSQRGTLGGNEQCHWDAAGNPVDNGQAEKVAYNRVTRLEGTRWQYDIHGRTVEKNNGQTCWRYYYDTEHRLTEVVSQPRDRNKPQTRVSFRYDPLGRRISKTRQQMFGGQPVGRRVTTRFLWEGFRLLQEIHDDVPLTYVYSDQGSYEPLARIDGTESPDVYWFHCQLNGTPERMTDIEGELRWEGQNSAWGKLLREATHKAIDYPQNLRMQGQYLDRETGLHYNLFRYYDPDCGRFTQHDPIGLAGGINLYRFAPNALVWMDPLGLATAIVYWLAPSPDQSIDATGHYTVKVMGDKILHTHQYGGYEDFVNEGGRNVGVNPTDTMIASDGQSQVNNAKLQGKPVHQTTFDMTDAGAEKALEFQRSQVGKSLGPYDVRTRSCLTHVMEVLSAGGVDVPQGAMRQYHFIQKKLGVTKCKQGGS